MTNVPNSRLSDSSRLPTPSECIARAWAALSYAQDHLPLSSQAAFYAESQAWSALAVALRGHVPAPTPVAPAAPGPNEPEPVIAPPKREPDSKPKAQVPDKALQVLRERWAKEQG